jgi:vanillate O-demethylase oxygenase-like protein
MVTPVAVASILSDVRDVRSATTATPQFGQESLLTTDLQVMSEPVAILRGARLVRNFGTDSDDVAEQIRSVFHQTAERDIAVLETVQRQLGEDLEPRRDINVKADRAAIRARRVTQAMVREEAGRAGLRPIITAASSNGGRNS